MSQSPGPLVTVNILRYALYADAHRRLPVCKRNHPGILEQLALARIAAERDLEWVRPAEERRRWLERQAEQIEAEE
jgi:hypothetical protein